MTACSRFKKAGLFFGLAILILYLIQVNLWPQATATITGTVADSSGAVVPGAKIRVTNLATSSVRETVTTEEGIFRVTQLAPGEYSVSASQIGFRTTVTRLEVTVGQVARAGLTLAIGEITEEVVITDAAAPVDVEQGRVSSVVDEDQIQDLPLNGRNVYQLMQLSPGAVNTVSTVYEPGQGTNVNGGRTSMNGFWLDGISTKGLSGGTGYEGLVGPVPGGQPNLEAIQEFRIETTNFSAEFGNSVASIVNVVSKSGSNELHGSVYWFNRSDTLDAREFFDEEKPPYRHNQFGFSLGGPIVKNRTFFFGSYEGTRIRTGESRLESFESQDWSSYAAGYARPVASFLYSNYPAPELDSVTYSVGEYLVDNGWVERPVDENQNLLDDTPASQEEVDAFLGALFGSPSGALSAEAPMTGQASFFTPDDSDSDGFSLRIDQELGERDRLYGRYFHNNTDAIYLFPRPAFNAPQSAKAHLLAVNWTHVFGVTIVNEIRAGLTRYDFKETPGVPGVPWIADGSLYSTFLGGGDLIFREDIVTGADTLSLTIGNHGVKLGGEIRSNVEDSEFDASVPSYYFFDLIYLALDDPYYQSAGVDPNLSEDPCVAELATNIRKWKGIEIGLFFNDDWKVRPNLTLNLGLRWDWYGRLTESDNLAATFDLSNGDNVFERVFNGSFVGPVDKLSEDDWNNLSPRLGFAWDPFSNGKMAVRAGYGIAFQSAIFNPLSNSRWNPPFYSFSAVSPIYGIGDNILYGPQDESPVRADGPNPNPGASQTVGNIIAYDGNNPNLAALTAIPNPRMRDPYVQSFFAGIQRELFRDIALEVNYVGTLGRKLMRADDFNRFTGDLLGLPSPNGDFAEPGCDPFGDTETPADDCAFNRVNPNEGVLRFWENSVNSNYHALQLQVNRRYAKGLAFNANYTLAKSLDTRSTWHSGRTTSNKLQEGFSTDVQNQQLDHGRSVFDARHRFTASWLWELPHFDATDSRFLREVFGGWQINGIVALQSGQPFTPYNGMWFSRGGGDWNADGWRNDRPNTPAIGNSISSERSDFVNPNAGIFDIPGSSPDQAPSTADKLEYFGEPDWGTNGDLGRNTYEGPGFASVDLSFFKEFPVGALSEEARLQFRLEFFNLFNRVNFFQPEPEIDNDFFGQATEVFDAREIQLGLKFVF